MKIEHVKLKVLKALCLKGKDCVYYLCERMILREWSHLAVSTMKIGFDAGIGPGCVKCEESSLSKVDQTQENDSLKSFIETDAKYSLLLTLSYEYELLTRTRISDQDPEPTRK